MHQTGRYFLLTGFYGSTNLDTLRIDEVTNLFDDQLRVIGRYRWAKTPEEKVCRLLSASVGFCQLLSASVSFCRLLSASVSFCRLLSASVGFCQLLSASVSFCRLLSASVSFCRLLSASVGFCQLLSASLSLADFYLYDMTENLLWLKKDALQPFPLLQKLRQNVEADPKIKAYLATRKQTEY
nr:hypothetical protein BaRGS_034787 [Batillaria attramentaria]